MGCEQYSVGRCAEGSQDWSTNNSMQASPEGCFYHCAAYCVSAELVVASDSSHPSANMSSLPASGRADSVDSTLRVEQLPQNGVLWNLDRIVCPSLHTSWSTFACFEKYKDSLCFSSGMRPVVLQCINL